MELDRIPAAQGGRKQRKRVGRGPSSGTGKTSGKGHKGQKARSGYSIRRGFEGGQMPLNRRLPKRGFTQQKRVELTPVNVGILEDRFESGAEVTPETLAKAKVMPRSASYVKILARGDLSKALTVKAHAVSQEARRKIEEAGGSVELVVPRSR